MKCYFTHCTHGGEITTDEYVTIKGKHYHTDCAKIRNEIAYIRNLWIDRIDNHVSITHLQKCLNDLIFQKGYDVDFIVFAIEYTLDNHLTLRYPGGIKYFLNNKEIKKAFDIKQTKAQTVNLKNYIKSSAEEPKESVIYRKKKRRSLLEDLFNDGV